MLRLFVAIISIFSITHLYMYNVSMLDIKTDNINVEKRIYDINNIFARILRSELPCKQASYDNIVFENQHAVAIYDINPRKNVHILLLPKGQYIDLRDFLTNASVEEKLDAYNLLADILKHCKDGRVENNFDSYQEIPHLHWHIMADHWV